MLIFQVFNKVFNVLLTGNSFLEVKKEKFFQMYLIFSTRHLSDTFSLETSKQMFDCRSFSVAQEL